MSLRRTTIRYVALSLWFGPGSTLPAQQTGTRASQPERIGRLEKQIDELRTTLEIPGLSAVVVRDRRVVWAKGFGWADAERKVAATPETNYRIASLTKMFASTLLMQLVEQGKLDLNAPMAKYSPEFQKRFGTDAVTVRHVFSHTSHGAPGESYRYDGNRFSYLTAVIEAASGRSFRELLVRNILDKIAMLGSVPGQDILDDRAMWSAFLDTDHTTRYEAGLAKLATPYRLHGVEITRAVYPPRRISASAGLVSNVIDLAKYDAAIDGHAFIGAATQERAWTPARSSGGRTLPYGLGWFVQQLRGVRLIWHYGYWPDSFSSLYLKVPEKDITFILLANSDGLSAPFRLGGGDVSGSAFATDFLRIFVFEDALGHALPDPRWSEPSDRFESEVGLLVATAGGYPYEAERTAHDFLTRWLDQHRRSAPKEITVDPKVYDQYVGRYEGAPGEAFSIVKEDNRLFVEALAFPKMEAFPEARDRFFLKAIDMRLTFVREGDGRVVRADVDFWGQRTRAAKVRAR